MLQGNSSSGKIPNNAKPAKPNRNASPKAGVRTRTSAKKSVLGVSNISVSIRSSKKTTDTSKQKAGTTPAADAEINKSEKGIQVDEVEIIATNCESGDARNVIVPSAKVIQEIERNNKLKRQQQLKARLHETRKFEEHAAKQEIHLTNLKEFMDTGAITRKREPGIESRMQLEDSLKPVSDRTKTALEAYDRIKRKEEELLKMFNSI